MVEEPAGDKANKMGIETKQKLGRAAIVAFGQGRNEQIEGVAVRGPGGEEGERNKDNWEGGRENGMRFT